MLITYPEVKKWSKRMINLGVSTQSSSKKLVTRLINGLCIIGDFAIILHQIVSIYTAGFQVFSLAISIIYLFLFSSLLFLNAINQWKWSHRVFILLTYACLISQHFAYDSKINSWITMICCVAFYGVIFNEMSKVVFHSLAMMTLTAVSISLQHSPSHHSLNQYPDSSVITYKIIFFVTTSIMVLTVILLGKTVLIKHQQELELLLAERNLMLKEIHHRVKNNLQVVSSLFNLQERRLPLENREAREMINSSQVRIQSMASVHEQLYNSSNLKTIKLKAYVENLVHHLSSMYEKPSNKISINIEIDNSFLPLETVIPIGFIITESVTNSLKYAFPNGKEGEIDIKYKSKENKHFLVISDNGVGIHQNEINSFNNTGIGIQLINDMTSQLSGTHKMEFDKGIKHTFTFDLNKSSLK